MAGPEAQPVPIDAPLLLSTRWEDPHFRSAAIQTLADNLTPTANPVQPG